MSGRTRTSSNNSISSNTSIRTSTSIRTTRSAFKERPPWNGSLFDPATSNAKRPQSKKSYFSVAPRVGTSQPNNVGSSRSGLFLRSMTCVTCQRCGARVKCPGEALGGGEIGEQLGPEWNSILEAHDEISSTLAAGLTSPAAMRYLRRQLEELNRKIIDLCPDGDLAGGGEELVPPATPPPKNAEPPDESPEEKMAKGKGKGKAAPPLPVPNRECGKGKGDRNRKRVVPPNTRRLHWQTLPNDRIKGTVFDDLPWDSMQAPEVITTLFTNSCIQSTQRAKPRKTEMLTASRAQTVLLVLKSCPLTAKLMWVLEELDFDVDIDQDVFEMLYTAIPTPDESKLLQDYRGNVSELRDAEQLVLPLARLCNPPVNKRLQFLLFSKTFPDLVRDTSRGLSALQLVLQKIHESCAIRSVLRHVRSLGNLLNLGLVQFSDDAIVGFRLDVLDRLSVLKSTRDARISLLHVLVSRLVAEDESLPAALQDLLDAIQQALKTPLSILAEHVAAIRQESDHCAMCVAEAKAMTDGTVARRLEQNLECLAERASPQASVLKDSLEKTESMAVQTLFFFGEDVHDTVNVRTMMEDFLKLLLDFLSAIRNINLRKCSSMLASCYGK